MSAANGGVSGQAPANDPQPGQAPIVNNGGSPSTAPTGQAPEGHTTAPLTAADYDRIIRELRDENARHRTNNADLSGKLKQFQDAQAATDLAKLSDLEKVQKQYADAQQTIAALQIEQQQYRLVSEIAKHAPALNLIDTDAARLMLLAAGELETDANGNYTNVAKQLEKLVAAKPYLVASNANRPPAPPSSGGATNPGRGTGVAPQGQPTQRVDPRDAYKAHRQGGGLGNPGLWKK